MKLAAIATGGIAFAGQGSFARAQEREAEPESPIYLALNMSKVTNSEERFRLMNKVGPRPEAVPSPPEYLIHSEWDAPELAQLGFGKVLMNHRLRKVHDDGVMAHTRPLYYVFPTHVGGAGLESYAFLIPNE